MCDKIGCNISKRFKSSTWVWIWLSPASLKSARVEFVAMLLLLDTGIYVWKTLINSGLYFVGFVS